MTGSKNATRWMLDVTAGPSGYVAVGGSRDGKGNHPSVWVSPDGKQWTLRVLELPASGVTEGHLTHVAAKGNTLVAAGIAATQRGLDWLGYVSTDAGRTWRPLESPSGETQATITALTATPKGFAATGTTGRARRDRRRVLDVRRRRLLAGGRARRHRPRRRRRPADHRAVGLRGLAARGGPQRRLPRRSARPVEPPGAVTASRPGGPRHWSRCGGAASTPGSPSAAGRACRGV
ncbi:hypothetical protein LUX33_21870 [Actinomadura madurae]|uniref:hypothetical protein n=1 Tax=Actinomadura madurae TaxID=1993 RepID=UPI0020D23729|nr:hypothetical protein [Actinomadura madurae]MCP9950796.1 hypothetical protein [Actinomadura madurae]